MTPNMATLHCFVGVESDPATPLQCCHKPSGGHLHTTTQSGLLSGVPRASGAGSRSPAIEVEMINNLHHVR
jgi:hypothetical protein